MTIKIFDVDERERARAFALVARRSRVDAEQIRDLAPSLERRRRRSPPTPTLHCARARTRGRHLAATTTSRGGGGGGSGGGGRGARSSSCAPPFERVQGQRRADSFTRARRERASDERARLHANSGSRHHHQMLACYRKFPTTRKN